MFTGEVDYRLKEVFEKDFFQESISGFSFVEKSAEGEMELDLKVNNLSLCIMNLDKKKPIPFLNQNKGRYNRRTDFAVFELVEDKICRLHIFEMTTTVNQSKWVTKIKQQTKSSYVYCFAIAACLNIEIRDTIFYTIFANDEFEKWATKEDDNSTALLKPMSGVYYSNPKYEWDNNIIQFDFGGLFKFKHEKINITKKDKEHPSGTFEIR